MLLLCQSLYQRGNEDFLVSVTLFLLSLMLSPSNSCLRDKHITQCSQIGFTCLVTHWQKLEGARDLRILEAWPLLSFVARSNPIAWNRRRQS